MKRFGDRCRSMISRKFAFLIGLPLIFWVLMWIAAVFLWFDIPRQFRFLFMPLNLLFGAAMAVGFIGAFALDQRRRRHTLRLEHELNASRTLFDAFMAHLPALAFIKDGDGRYLFANAASGELLSTAPEQLVGKTDSDIWPEAVAERIRRHDLQVLNDRQGFSAVEAVAVGDRTRHYLFTRFPISDAATADQIAGVAFDISDKIEAQQDKADLEELLIQSQKMEAIGTLAGGIAHDFNNLLSAILGYVELARLDAPSHGSFRKYLTQVLRATHRAKKLVGQILAFSRKSVPDHHAIDPRTTVEEVLAMLKAMLPATIEIRSELALQDERILADGTQLQQVVMNLCTNGAHAMEDGGGVLSVDLTRSDLNGSEAKAFGLPPGGYVRLSVRDTGHGMKPETLAQIFDPYFTTKESGKGTGMGLAMVQGIVAASGGRVRVSSEPGEGTDCQVLLPIAEGEDTPSLKCRNPLPTGRESILFVDDEKVLLDVVDQMLRRLGYRVVCCNRSTEALAMVKADPDRFDLVITDLTMPEMTGDCLAEELLKLRTDLPIILCSGHSRHQIAKQIHDYGITAFIAKPLTIQDMAHTVRRALDHPLSQGLVHPVCGVFNAAPN